MSGKSLKIGAIWTLGIGGWLTSYVLFVLWLKKNNWDFFGGWFEAFTTSDFSTGLHFDLVFVTLMMLVLALIDRKKLGLKWTLGVICSLSLSASMSLAVYVVGKMRSEE